jgi:hypothetical protein
MKNTDSKHIALAVHNIFASDSETDVYNVVGIILAYNNGKRKAKSLPVNENDT